MLNFRCPNCEITADETDCTVMVKPILNVLVLVHLMMIWKLTCSCATIQRAFILSAGVTFLVVENGLMLRDVL